METNRENVMFFFLSSTVMFVCRIPVALQNWVTECCYSNYSGHVVAPAPSTCLNADSSPVVPKQKTQRRQMECIHISKINKMQTQCDISVLQLCYLQQVCVNELGASHARGLV